MLSLVMLSPDTSCLKSVDPDQLVDPGGGGYSHFLFIRRLGSSIYRFKHPKKKNIWNFSNQKKYPSFCTLTLTLTLTTKYSPILWYPQKYPQNLHTQQFNYFSENTQKYWNSKFGTQKHGPSLCLYENIKVPPSPIPPGVDSYPHYVHSAWKHY